MPSSGELSLVDSLNEEHILSYSDKNLTQFLGVTTTTGDFNKKIGIGDICDILEKCSGKKIFDKCIDKWNI